MIFHRGSWKFTAEFFLILMTIIWGGTFISIKLALDEISPYRFLFLRFGIAFLVTCIIYSPRRSEIHCKSVLHGLWVGIVLFSGYLFQTLGLKDTTATKSGFITGAYVIFTPFWEAIFLHKIPKKIILFAVAIVFAGIYLISMDTESSLERGSLSMELSSGEFSFSKGEIFTLLGALCFALYIVVIDRASRFWNEPSLMVGQMGSSFLIAFLLLLSFEFDTMLQSLGLGLYGLWGLLYTGFIATMIPTLVQTRYQKAVTPTRAGIIYSLEPVFASFFAYLAARETLGILGFLGCGLIFSGIILSIRSDDHLPQLSKTSEPG